MSGGVDPSFRCSVASEGLGEPLAGTASTVRAFVAVECSGPWGIEAVRDCRLPDPVKTRLLELESGHSVRPLLIRRPGRTGGRGVRVFAAYVDQARPWTEAADLDHPKDLLDLDLAGLAQGRSPNMTRHEEPVFLVCTHGKHDACCAERGRPLAAALAAEAPAQTWEVSHIGGDRFAGNVLVLPHGLYYGRLAPEHARRFASLHLAGDLDLDHLRGRSSYPFAVQAAEVYLRRHLGLSTAGPLVLERSSVVGGVRASTFLVGGGRWEVRVRAGRQPARRLTCRATTDSGGLSHEMVGLTRL